MTPFSNLGNAGRLGNQLWQIAGTLGIARHYQDSCSFPDTWKYREYFRVPSDWFRDPQYLSGVEPQFTKKVEHIDPRARPYLQDVGLFTNVADEVRSYFSPTDSANFLVHGQHAWYFELPRPITAIHVRRGDNVFEGPWKAAYHPVPSLNYYANALEKIDGGSVVFFSDDLPWCKATFGPAYRYFEGGAVMPKEHEPAYATAVPTDWIDFFALCAADNFVLSNSTFGWWAAWLSESDNVTYPDPWYGAALDYIDTSLMFTGLNWSKQHAA